MNEGIQNTSSFVLFKIYHKPRKMKENIKIPWKNAIKTIYFYEYFAMWNKVINLI